MQIKRNYYLRGNRWSKKKIDKETKESKHVLSANVPLVSVFVIKEDDVFSRGIALCSDSDNPDKYIGRWLAHINAVEARDNFMSSKRILRVEAINVLNKVPPASQGPMFPSGHQATFRFACRSEYDVKLTPYEEVLFEDFLRRTDKAKN